ncbi:hypothetical protein SAMN05216456_3485 [Devosia crocina]|uniref:HTH cro/C1-type domain-containing protein n=1 Tax=Devosia crocina TaxID=429728 RepID=A0A1I7NV57_9HYPH|nr:helix-turn-helix transcriptional regulator [Devosia crocina]SFV38534.1 hypothetical protein SAMN05216456_3485 [Devosia crocina]
MSEAMIIDPERLVLVRKTRKIGRPKLAKLTGLSERAIARLEGALNAKGDVPLATVHRIAIALQVRPELLTGQLPFTMAALLPTEVPDCCSCGTCTAH